MSQSNSSSQKNNTVRVRVTIRGTRPFLQHAFTEHAIPLEKTERSGVAGNDPTEWERSKQITPDGILYFTPENIFSCLRDAAKYTKKGRGSIQSAVAATLQVEAENEIIPLLNRTMPETGKPSRDKTAPVYIDVSSVKNPSTKGRNVRYRLAASAGWECAFVVNFDKTLVSRQQMQAVANDAGRLVGIGDGRSIGKGRFMVLSFEELNDAEESPTEGGMGLFETDSLVERRKKMRALPEISGTDGSAH